MTYASVAQFRAYLPQVKTGAEIDAQIQDVLERATDVVNTYLGFRFEGFASATTRSVPSHASPYLWLPSHEKGSVTSAEQNGTAHTVSLIYDDDTLNPCGYLINANKWQDGRVNVTAKWGYGDAPAAVVEVCLETAVNIWRSRDRGQFTDVVGVETGGQIEVARQGAFTASQKSVLDSWKSRSHEVVV